MFLLPNDYSDNMLILMEASHVMNLCVLSMKLCVFWDFLCELSACEYLMDMFGMILIQCGMFAIQCDMCLKYHEKAPNVQKSFFQLCIEFLS
jgi:hypothetical protein